tara:strand:+ start:719 stop:1756 length:1038 start_codon:yes stop_codon:yes gene_type:complete
VPILKISNRLIGENYKPLIIVELGINHNGKFGLAKKIIDSAKKAGAEVIKHQTHIPYFEMSEEAKKIIPVHTKDNIYKIISDCSLSEKEEIKLQKYIQKKNMIFLSTPFSKEAADRLNKMKVPAFKIGSGECNNYPLIEYVCKFKKPIILSTGMNTINQIRESVRIIEKYKISYALMHTTNLYPTPYNLIRLNALKEMKKTFPRAVIGLSDHTGDNYTSLAAIAMGASIIEKHFVDSKKTRKGPDIPASIDFFQLRDLIDGAKKIKISLGGKKKPVKEEFSTMKFAFASVVSTKNIKKGSTLNKDNIWVKRPGTGAFLAKDFKKLLGKKAKRNIKLNTQIKKKDI